MAPATQPRPDAHEGTLPRRGSCLVGGRRNRPEATKPPEGAADVSVTLPVDVLPPTTSLGLSVTDDSDGDDDDGCCDGEGEGEGEVHPETVAETSVLDPSSTDRRQSAGFENGSRS